MHRTSSSQMVDGSASTSNSPERVNKHRLDRLNGRKDFDPVTFDVLMVKPIDFASQITLLDLPAFKAITPDVWSVCCCLLLYLSGINIVRLDEKREKVNITKCCYIYESFQSRLSMVSTRDYLVDEYIATCRHSRSFYQSCKGTHSLSFRFIQFRFC